MGDYLPANPRKLTDATAERLIEAFKLGASQAGACRYAGINDETLRLWVAAGRHELAVLSEQGVAVEEVALHDLPRTARLVLCLDLALGEFEVAGLAAIRAAGAADWRAVAWTLERRLRKDWAKDEPRGDRLTILLLEVERVAQERNLDAEATEKLKDFVREREKRRA